VYAEIKLDNIRLGYSNSAAKKGESAAISLMGFYSSEDGDELITRLEGFPQQLLSLMPANQLLLPSMVDTLVAVIRQDKTVSIYLNEVRTIAKIRVKKGVKKGALISKNDILDMEEVEFENIQIPDDAGFVYVFSLGWRKGFFYDFSPLHGEVRTYNLKKQLGNLHSYLTFQERFKISESVWSSLFAQRWFPFIYLDDDIVKKMILYAREGWRLDDLLPNIRENILKLLSVSNLFGKSNSFFEEHADLIERAIDRYKNEDYISCVSILYPRIEGIMRSFYRNSGYTETLSSNSLTKAVIEHNKSDRIPQSLLLPEKFHNYLQKVYFSNFAPGSNPDVGRHSVAHGEARIDDFSLKSSSIGILVLYQLSLFFRENK
jgi:hypothetical protein